MKTDFEPVIIAFCCHYCPYCSADVAGIARMQYPHNIRIIKIPCVGSVSVIHILKALESGVDGVYLAGCHDGNCQHTTGSVRASRRVQYVKEILKQIGVEGQRVEMYTIPPAHCKRFVEVAREMTERIRELGPSPLR
jgi:F420-non-reducing hydrogenase iron-sulfur subunit